MTMERVQWRLVSVQWDVEGACWPQMFPFESGGPPRDVPDVTPHVVPFQTFGTLTSGLAGWRTAAQGLWVREWAVRAHLSALLTCVDQGRGFEVTGWAQDTYSVWLRDTPPVEGAGEWRARVEQMFTSSAMKDAA